MNRTGLSPAEGPAQGTVKRLQDDSDGDCDGGKCLNNSDSIMLPLGEECLLCEPFIHLILLS